MTLPYDLNLFDVILLAVLALFSLRGVLRGFLAEVTGLIGLLLGILLAGRYYGLVGDFLARSFASNWVYVVAYVLVLCVVMFLISMVSRLLHAFLKLAYADWINHLAGAGVGFLKGLIGSIIMVSLLGFFLADAPFYKQSQMVPYIKQASAYVKAMLPPGLAAYVK